MLTELSKIDVLNDEIQSSFYHFEKGDCIFEVWLWVESQDESLVLGELL